MKRTPHRLLASALILVGVWIVLTLAGWDAGLEALTGMSPDGLGPAARGGLYGLAWLGAVGLAPILAMTGLSWLVARRVLES